LGSLISLGVRDVDTVGDFVDGVTDGEKVGTVVDGIVEGAVVDGEVDGTAVGDRYIQAHQPQLPTTAFGSVGIVSHCIFSDKYGVSEFTKEQSASVLQVPSDHRQVLLLP